MEWLFGSAPTPAVAVDATLSASTAQGRSAPAQEDTSMHKQRGNEHFKRKEYDEAIREYTLGIAIAPSATLYSNRSVSHIVYRRSATIGIRHRCAAIMVVSAFASTSLSLELMKSSLNRPRMERWASMGRQKQTVRPRSHWVRSGPRRIALRQGLARTEAVSKCRGCGCTGTGAAQPRNRINAMQN